MGVAKGCISERGGHQLEISETAWQHMAKQPSLALAYSQMASLLPGSCKGDLPASFSPDLPLLIPSCLSSSCIAQRQARERDATTKELSLPIVDGVRSRKLISNWEKATLRGWERESERERENNHKK